MIEVDDEWLAADEGTRRDQKRDCYLASSGYQVLRIDGYEAIRHGRSAIVGILAFVQVAIDIKSIASHFQPFSLKTGAKGARIMSERHNG